MVKMLKKYEGYALITGGSTGIGLEFAKQLAGQGYNLVIVARDTEKLEAAASSLKKQYPIDVITISQELSDPESTDNIYNILKEKKIKVGILVNNAGYGHTGYLHKADRKKLLNMINVMCGSLTDLTYKFLPDMLEKRSGAIIMISSIAGIVPGPLDSVYAASKAFSLELGISLHAEYGSQGIDFLTVCPGYADTNFFEISKTIRPSVTLISAEDIVSKSLKALGKEIYIKVINKTIKMHFLMFIIKFLPQKVIEKLIKQYYKDELHIQL